jgi:hypothetical protein
MKERRITMVSELLEEWRQSLEFKLGKMFIFQGEGFVQFFISNHTFCQGKRVVRLLILPPEVVAQLEENLLRIFHDHEIKVLRARSLRRPEPRDLELVETTQDGWANSELYGSETEGTV